ncbi:MAG: hypothetical protein U0414_09215 [Polyangiaceae bacterium]
MASRHKVLFGASALLLAGCDLVLGLDAYKEGPATGGAGGGVTSASTTTSSTTTASSTSSSGATTSSSSTGA